ncbi:response regulator [Thiorhodovibrio frisius]|uniref:histidine kinase n=1 Tax=Thiorhodovibrio frisius TaxID=631362 RepID=H8Z840_9GAMM|nr:response regulator [Thiorhodovibrio frisius]EIC19975.1 signal transduction histidine kinase [Thiorhodovibrio frisius]WPL20704.1 Sensor kinase protein RcsC [Thiorhodovibrio frisius]
MHAFARWITFAFVLLALGLGALVAGYWHVALKPGLGDEAQHQANLMAQAQADRLAGALVLALTEARSQSLRDVVNELLSLKEKDSGRPFFSGVLIELAPEGNALDPALLQQGDTRCQHCLVAEVPLLDPRDFHLIGLARFFTTDQFLREHLRVFRRHLLIQAALGGVLLVAAWAGVLALMAQMQRQRDRRERAEQTTAWTQARYERLLNRLQGYFVYARSADGRLLFASDSVREVLGCEPQVFCSELERFLVDVSSAAAVFPLGAGHAQLSASSVVRVRNAWGQLRQLECTETLAVDAPNGTMVIEGVARDVSTQKELEASLLEAKERAESANRAKTALLANVSHELRTPMSSIIGLAKLLLQADIPPAQRDRANKIRAAAQSLLRILDDILAVSKMEAGRVRLEERDFMLDEVLEQIASFAAIRNREPLLDIAFAIGPGVPRHLRGDPVRLGQVLLNLTSNAIKFTPSGSVLLCIEQAARAPGRSEAVGQPDQRDRRSVRLKFALEDTGIGIASEDLQRLFQPFSQLDASASRTQGGTGLGLAISRHLVQLMGGDIEVESQPQGGSIFRFAAEFGLSQEEEQLSGPNWPEPVTRALIVSDRELTQALFGQSLNRFGLAVALATSSSEALAMLGDACRKERAFALVLIDARLADAQAAAVAARQMRQQPEIDPKPAVVLIGTLGAMQSDQAQTGDGLFDGLVTSAISNAALRGVLLCALDQALPQDREVSQLRAPVGQIPPGTRVLVADDHAVNREIAVDVLEGLGFEVTAAADGFEALACLGRERFDAVLIDIRMPGLDGFEVTERLRADPRLARLPVIALTAHGMIEGEHLCRGAGMSGLLSKPLDENELLKTLLPLLRHHDAKGPDDRRNDQAPAWAGTEADFHSQLTRAVPVIADYVAREQQADAIALAQRLKTAARLAGETQAAEALADLQRALVKSDPVVDPGSLLEPFMTRGSEMEQDRKVGG